MKGRCSSPRKSSAIRRPSGSSVAEPDSCERLVDDGDTRRSLAIAVAEAAALPDLHAHRLEVARRHVVDTCVRPVVGSIRIDQRQPQVLHAEQAEPRHARSLERPARR